MTNRFRWALSLTWALASVVVTPGLAAAQFAGKSAISPLVPPTLNAPVFDTVTPHPNVPDPKGAENTLVAEVDGRPITLGEVTDQMRDMPAGVQQMEFGDLFPMARGQLIAKVAVAVEADRKNLRDDPVIRRRIQMAADMIVADEYLRREASKDITEKAILARYQRDIAGKPGPDELHIRVITVSKLDQAQELLKQLRAGADFADLARRFSEDPTASAGGDAGFLAPDELHSSVSAAALALPVGQIAATPLPGEGHWFLIRLEGRRSGDPIPYAEIREQLKTQIIREKTTALATQILSKAIVRVYDFMGEEENQAARKETVERPGK